MTLKEFKDRSIEYEIIRSHRNIFCFITLVLVIIVSAIIIVSGNDTFLILLIPASFAFLLFSLYYIKQTSELINNHKYYKYLTVEFKEMHPGFLNGSAYFTLNFEYNLKQYNVDTKDIFSTNFNDLKKPMYDKFLNKNGLIAFNPKTSQVVVIDVYNNNEEIF